VGADPLVAIRHPPATIAARPASSWLTAAARPGRADPTTDPAATPAASRTAAPGRTPSSRRSTSSQISACLRAAPPGIARPSGGRAGIEGGDLE
jgi:hypothetical protein